jgi:sarcosine oxidase
VKVGEHHAGPIVTADTRSFEIDQTWLKRLTNYVSTHLPNSTGEAFDVTSCLYTNTPDEHFIMDTLPDHPQVIVASPCSGHGFKFSILIGRILADLVERGKTDYSIGMFGLKRFL